MLKLVPFYFCCTGISTFKNWGLFFLQNRLDRHRPCFIQLFSMLIITSRVMLAKLYHCMTIVPDCMSVSMSFKCLCRFYNSLQLLMCDCEDLVPAQELKGTSLPSPVVDSWDWVDKSKMLNLFWKYEVSTLEDCAPPNVKDPFSFCFSHKLFLPKKSNADTFSEQFSCFCSCFVVFVFVFFCFFTWKISSSECYSSERTWGLM